MSNLMIACRRCQAKISPDAASCPQCGDPQAIGDRGRRVRCGQCRTDNDQYLTACRGCGNDLAADRAFRDACEHNSAAGHRRDQFASWGAWAGIFLGLFVGLAVLGLDKTFWGVVGGVVVIGITCGLAWAACRGVAGYVFPYRFPASLPPERLQELRNMFRE